VERKNPLEELKKLPPEKRERVIAKLKELTGNRKLPKEEIEGILKVLLRLYL